MSKRFLVIQFVLISLLAVISHYQVPDLTDSNWTTALFLTPSGIISNYINRDTTVIWSFYSDPSEGQISLSSLQMFGMLFVYLLMINSVIMGLKSFMTTSSRVKK